MYYNNLKIISMKNKNIEATINLLSNCSIETTPNVYEKYGNFIDLERLYLLRDEQYTWYTTYFSIEGETSIGFSKHFFD